MSKLPHPQLTIPKPTTAPPPHENQANTFMKWRSPAKYMSQSVILLFHSCCLQILNNIWSVSCSRWWGRWAVSAVTPDPERIFRLDPCRTGGVPRDPAAQWPLPARPHSAGASSLLIRPTYGHQSSITRHQSSRRAGCVYTVIQRNVYTYHFYLTKCLNKTKYNW